MTPKDVKKIRGKLSRSEFGLALGVSSITVWRWEAGQAKAEGASLRLLELLRTHRHVTMKLLNRYLISSIEKSL
jgi:DNA-binding transcriptional regulator YiaG